VNLVAVVFRTGQNCQWPTELRQFWKTGEIEYIQLGSVEILPLHKNKLYFARSRMRIL
jgi:hypothetical protein